MELGLGACVFSVMAQSLAGVEQSVSVFSTKHGCMEAAIAESQRSGGTEVAQVLLLIDPGQDLDDELLLLLLSVLDEHGVAKCQGVVTTLGPAALRAGLARGTLDGLGLTQVPVGVGSDGGASGSTELFEHLGYLSMANFEDGQALMRRVLQEAAPRSITVVVAASHRDIKDCIAADEALFQEKVGMVVSMGGVAASSLKIGELLQPDSANNNTFDMPATQHVFARCQQLGVPMIIVSRFAAYACQLPRTLYDRMAGSGADIGQHLKGVQCASIETLWRKANSPPGSHARANLPARCDKEWFIKTFCASSSKAVKLDGNSPIWDHVTGFNMYDPLALLAATPALRHLFDFVEHTVDGTIHRVAGISAESPGVTVQAVDIMAQAFLRAMQIEQQVTKGCSPRAVSLRQTLAELTTAGGERLTMVDCLACNHEYCEPLATLTGRMGKLQKVQQSAAGEEESRGTSRSSWALESSRGKVTSRMSAVTRTAGRTLSAVPHAISKRVSTAFIEVVDHVLDEMDIAIGAPPDIAIDAPDVASIELLNKFLLERSANLERLSC